MQGHPNIITAKGMSQHVNALPIWDTFFKEHGIATVLELGAGGGGFTRWISERVDRVVSFDIQEPKSRQLDQCANVTRVVTNVFRPKGYRLVVGYIDSLPRPFLLICDNGDKIREFNTYGPLLRSDDFISAHDYCRTKEDHAKYMKNKIWQYHEIWDEAIQATLDLGFVEETPEIFIRQPGVCGS